MDVIDTFLATFITYIDSGFGLLAGDVAYLSTTLIAIDITLAGLFWALSQNADVIAGLLKKVLYVGFFAFIIGNFSILANIVFDSFAALGVTRWWRDDDRRGSPAPRLYCERSGLDAGQPLLEEISDMVGPISFFHNFITIAIMFVAWADHHGGLLRARRAALHHHPRVQADDARRLRARAVRALEQDNVSRRTRARQCHHVGHQAHGAGRHHRHRLDAVRSVTDAFRTGDDVTLAQVMGTVLAAIVFFWMGIFAPGIASGLITGAPQLGAGSAVGATPVSPPGPMSRAWAARAAAALSRVEPPRPSKPAPAWQVRRARHTRWVGRVRRNRRGAGLRGLAGVARAGGDAMRRLPPTCPIDRDAYRVAVRRLARHRRFVDRAKATPAPIIPEPRLGAAHAEPAARRSCRTDGGAHLRDGDRGASGALPTLKDKDD